MKPQKKNSYYSTTFATHALAKFLNGKKCTSLKYVNKHPKNENQDWNQLMELKGK